MPQSSSRRTFLKNAGLGAAALGFSVGSTRAAETIQGFDEVNTSAQTERKWQPFSDRKIRVGIVGFGQCQFGAQFSFQNHPNVEVVAVSDLIPERCRGLAKACRCEKTYPSLEEMVKDDTIEAIFCATDAPSHARHAMEVLKHGKHVAVAVPAVWGSLDDAEKLFEAVNAAAGLKYMMFETSAYRPDCYAMRQAYRAGAFGKLMYAEGEYYHFGDRNRGSYKGWRDGLPPQWYPTHSNAYYVCVTNGSFTEVSCLGMPSIQPRLHPDNNRYKNPFGTEIAQMRTSDGGMARMAVSWDSWGTAGEVGRVRGQYGGMFGTQYVGRRAKQLPELRRPPLPSEVESGGHGGSHGYLCNEFLAAIIQDRRPLVDICQALNMTVAGIVAHQSALKDGEWMKIPQYTQ